MTENGNVTSNEEKDNGGGQFAWSQEIPNYGDKLLKRLDEFRKSTILYDVRLRAEGGEFNAHKVILAACGGIFRTCFVDEKTKMISGTMTDIRLDCPAQGIKPILRFAYSGSLIITNRIAVATMQAADVTKMKEVQEICADIAIKEYGWIISDKQAVDEALTEKLGKVLQIHHGIFPKIKREENNISSDASCLHLCRKNSDEGSLLESSDLPYFAEVKEHFPDYVLTYQNLAVCLKKARKLGTKSSNGSKEKSTKALSATEKESVARKKSSSADEAENTESPRNKDKEVMKEIIKEKEKKEVNTLATNGSAQVEHVPMISPRKEKKIETTVRPKPRASIKKAAPAPPPPPTSPKTSSPPTGKAPPPRPKQPTKTPPPRPRPPSAKKKISNGDDTEVRNAQTAIKEEETDDYDDSLNPFA